MQQALEKAGEAFHCFPGGLGICLPQFCPPRVYLSICLSACQSPGLKLPAASSCLYLRGPALSGITEGGENVCISTPGILQVAIMVHFIRDGNGVSKWQNNWPRVPLST